MALLGSISSTDSVTIYLTKTASNVVANISIYMSVIL